MGTAILLFEIAIVASVAAILTAASEYRVRLANFKTVFAVFSALNVVFVSLVVIICIYSHTEPLSNAEQAPLSAFVLLGLGSNFRSISYRESPIFLRESFFYNRGRAIIRFALL